MYVSISVEIKYLYVGIYLHTLLVYVDLKCYLNYVVIYYRTYNKLYLYVVILKY